MVKLLNTFNTYFNNFFLVKECITYIQQSKYKLYDSFREYKQKNLDRLQRYAKALMRNEFFVFLGLAFYYSPSQVDWKCLSKNFQGTKLRSRQKLFISTIQSTFKSIICFPLSRQLLSDMSDQALVTELSGQLLSGAQTRNK